MALVWMELYAQTGEASWLAPAYTVLDAVKRAQLVDSPSLELRGAVPGCAPMWGEYNAGTVLSWAAKFLIDALQRKALIEKEAGR